MIEWSNNWVKYICVCFSKPRFHFQFFPSLQNKLTQHFLYTCLLLNSLAQAVSPPLSPPLHQHFAITIIIVVVSRVFGFNFCLLLQITKQNFSPPPSRLPSSHPHTHMHTHMQTHTHTHTHTHTCTRTCTQHNITQHNTTQHNTHPLSLPQNFLGVFIRHCLTTQQPPFSSSAHPHLSSLNTGQWGRGVWSVSKIMYVDTFQEEKRILQHTIKVQSRVFWFPSERSNWLDQEKVTIKLWNCLAVGSSWQPSWPSSIDATHSYWKIQTCFVLLHISIILCALFCVFF